MQGWSPSNHVAFLRVKWELAHRQSLRIQNLWLPAAWSPACLHFGKGQFHVVLEGGMAGTPAPFHLPRRKEGTLSIMKLSHSVLFSSWELHVKSWSG